MPLETQVMIAVAALVLIAVLLGLLLARSGRRDADPLTETLRSRVEELQRELAETREQSHAAVQAVQTRERDTASALSRSESRLEAELARAAELAQRLAGLEPLRGELPQLQAQHAALREQLAETRDRLAQAEREGQAQRQQVQDLTAQNAAHLHALDEAARRQTDQERWFTERTQTFELRIRELTSQLFKQQADEAQLLHKRNLDEVLAPFRLSLGEFRQQVEHFAREQATEREGLRSHVATLAGVHSNLSAQTDALTRALTTQNKQAGNWGETQLVRLLESVGFVEGTHYRCQVTVQGAEDGGVQRPDVILDLPEDRQVVIDAKVSIAAWTRAHSTDSEDERRALLKEHVASLRRHVSDLGAKDYGRSPDIHTLDFVVMFVPVEAAYVAAASEDPGLFQDAFGRGVIIASPTLLLALLKLVNSLWNMHKQEENAQAVLELGNKLHAKLAGFAASFEDIGNRLGSASKAFDIARGQLLSGNGNAMRLLGQLEKRGIAARKALPLSMRRDMGGAEMEDEADTDPDGNAEPEALGSPSAPP